MYRIIDNLPIDYDFSSKTNKELKLYEKWFKDNKEIRLSELFKYITKTKGFENFKMDYLPESLIKLEKWLAKEVEEEKLTEEEFLSLYKDLPDYIEVDDYDMTTKTRSILIDTGIYFGEVFINNYPKLQWKQYISRSKHDSSRGHMLVDGFGLINLNPILTLQGIGYSLLNKIKNDNMLYELYKTWEAKLS